MLRAVVAVGCQSTNGMHKRMSSLIARGGSNEHGLVSPLSSEGEVGACDASALPVRGPTSRRIHALVVGFQCVDEADNGVDVIVEGHARSLEVKLVRGGAWRRQPM